MRVKERVAKEKLDHKRGWKAYLFLLPSLLGTGLFVLIPFFDVIRRSFGDTMAKKFVGMANYQTVWKNEAFLLAAKNTILFTVICIPLLLVISFLFALLLHGLTQGFLKELMKTSFLIPMAIPVSSIVFLWKIFFHDNGLVNRILEMIGEEPVSFLHSGRAFWVLIGTYVWKNIGYDCVLWLSGLASIPESLYEAAKIDGAGKFACFRYITLPGIKPVFYLTTVLSLVNSFKVFREAYLIGGSYPDESMYLLQHLFNNWFVNLEVTKLYAAAVLMAIVVTLLLLLLKKGFPDVE